MGFTAVLMQGCDSVGVAPLRATARFNTQYPEAQKARRIAGKVGARLRERFVRKGAFCLVSPLCGVRFRRDRLLTASSGYGLANVLLRVATRPKIFDRHVSARTWAMLPDW